MSFSKVSGVTVSCKVVAELQGDLLLVVAWRCGSALKCKPLLAENTSFPVTWASVRFLEPFISQIPYALQIYNVWLLDQSWMASVSGAKDLETHCWSHLFTHRILRTHSILEERIKKKSWNRIQRMLAIQEPSPVPFDLLEGLIFHFFFSCVSLKNFVFLKNVWVYILIDID